MPPMPLGNTPASATHHNGNLWSQQFCSIYSQDTTTADSLSEPHPGAFARSAAELLCQNVPKFRQLPCRTFISVGTCPYRERCVYLHDPRLMCRDAKTKTRKKNKEDIVLDSLYWPVLPFHEVNHRLDSNHEPHVIQRYGVPCPQDNQYRRHDQAVYSMWMHFVTFCSGESAISDNHHNIDAEVAASARPAYFCALNVARTALPASSPGGVLLTYPDTYQYRKRCIILDETLALNPFINVCRLDVFRALSSGEGLRSSCTTKQSTIHSTPATSRHASPHMTRACSPMQVPLIEGSQPAPHPIFPRTNSEHRFNSMDYAAPSLPPAISCTAFNFNSRLDNADCRGVWACRSNIPHSRMSPDIGGRRRYVQRRNCMMAASHPYYSGKFTSASASTVRYEATLLNRKLLPIKDYTSSFPVPMTAPSMPQHQFLQENGSRNISDKERTAPNLTSGALSGNTAIASEEHFLYGIGDESNTSMRNFDSHFNTRKCNDLPLTTSPFSCISPTKTGREVPALLIGNLHLSPVSHSTRQSNSPFGLAKASPTGVSDISSCHHTPLCKTPWTHLTKYQTQPSDSNCLSGRSDMI